VNWVLDLDVRSFFDMLSHLLAGPVSPAPDSDRPLVASHPEMGAPGVLEEGKTDGDGGRVATRWKCIAPAGEHLSPFTCLISGFRHGGGSGRTAT